MARGYDVTAKARLPWFHHFNTSVSFEQYFLVTTLTCSTVEPAITTRWRSTRA